jgi:hypothetical protein
MELLEIAPGIDLKRDILDQMEFVPIMKEPLKRMDERIFQTALMGLAETFFNLPLEERFSYDPGSNLFYINFEGFTIKTHQDIQQIREAMDRILAPLAGVDASSITTISISNRITWRNIQLVKLWETTTKGHTLYRQHVSSLKLGVRSRTSAALPESRNHGEGRRILKKSDTPGRGVHIQNVRASRGGRP